jgi:hypothetical protein
MTDTPDDEEARHSREEAPAGDPNELFGLEGQERQATLSWFDEHLPEIRRAAFGDRLLYQSIVLCIVLGLVAHAGGYLIRSSATSETVGLLADLLYQLGYALWTGSVVVVLLEVVPKVKRRQFREALEAYERAQREADDQAPAEGDTRDGPQGPTTSPGGST